METPNLGTISIAQAVINYLSKFSKGDLTKAYQLACEILKSNKIEQIKVPFASSSFMISNNDVPDTLEFWVHQSSSMVFIVIPKDGYRLVSMALKQDMSDFIFDNP